jgi:CheY-like chemotaxis protein
MQKLRVLVAEDHPVNQAVIGAILSLQDYDYKIVDNGLEAVQSLAQETFDVILMDIQMEGMDGYQATKEIRSREAGTGTHVRIIAVTGNATESDRTAFIAAGMDGYIAKPVDPTQLIAVLTNVEVSEVSIAKPEAKPDQDEPLQVFNQEHLQAQVLGQTVPSIQMATLFLNELPTNIARLEQALAENDSAQIVRTAHRMGGAAAMLGAEQMALLAEQLEANASALTADTLKGLAALIAQVKAAAEALSKELKAFLNLST